jgi:regulator of sirC expression with transglutaminase-like and TPR domain
MGLTGSVVQGVLSARREFELGDMLQIAIPVEPGNSGGPILDRQGRVHGIMTMKSTVTANLGFAMPINTIKPLIAKPNPVPMQRWLTIGALNPKEWNPIMGAQWLQRAGRITVKEAGSGFGGRSLCLSKKATPEFPYELEVSLKLDDEAGAAGLVFSSDGDQKHYGFYPSGGKLRLTRFDGPNVFTWTILKDADSEHYKPGDWNTIKVRHEKDLIHCLVNDQVVFKIEDNGLSEGHVGLAKFRNTKAEFRNFRLGKKLASLAPPAELLAKFEKAIAKLEPKNEFAPDTVNNLKNQADINQNLIRKRAEQLEIQAKQLRRLADIVHEKSVQDQLIKLMDHPKNKTDLLHAALLISRLDNAELEIAHYKRTVEGMAEDIQSTLPAKASNDDKLNALRKYMFEENGYHGSRGDYYNRSNSYINEVIDDREGIPITLSALYMELARQLGLKMAGIGLPGHFVVAQLRDNKEPQLIDVYEGAKLLTRKDAGEIVRNIAGIPLQAAHLEPVDNRAIIVRMLRNLIGVSNDNEPPETVLRYLNTLILLQPDSPQERLNRALIHMRLKKNEKAKEDVRWLLDNNPAGFNRERLLELFERL